MSSLKLYFSAIPLINLLGIASNKNCIFLICNGLLVFVAKTSDGSVLSSSGFDLNDLLQRKIGDSLPPTLEIEEPSSLLIKDDEENEEVREENEAEATKEEKEEKKLKNLVMEDSEGDGGGGNFNADDVENELLFGEPKQEEEEEVVDECPCEEEEKKLTNLVMEELEGDGPGDGGGGENCNLQDENDLEIGLLFDEVEEDNDDEEEEESMETLSTDELNNKFEDFIRRMKEDIRMGRNNYNDQVNYNYDINLYDKNWPIIIVN